MEGNFAELVDGAAQQLGLNDYQLSAAIGLLSRNRVYSSKQVRRLRNGEVRHHDPELVQRLISILDLDPDTAWHAAGLWPPALDLATYRRLKELAATPANGVSARYDDRSLPLDVDDAEFAQLIDQNRPHLAVVVPLEPRRDRRADDRHLHLVRPVVAEQVPA